MPFGITGFCTGRPYPFPFFFFFFFWFNIFLFVNFLKFSNYFFFLLRKEALHMVEREREREREGLEGDSWEKREGQTEPKETLDFLLLKVANCFLYFDPRIQFFLFRSCGKYRSFILFRFFFEYI
jgi:hypothetical protein